VSIVYPSLISIKSLHICNRMEKVGIVIGICSFVLTYFAFTVFSLLAKSPCRIFSSLLRCFFSARNMCFMNFTGLCCHQDKWRAYISYVFFIKKKNLDFMFFSILEVKMLTNLLIFFLSTNQWVHDFVCFFLENSSLS